MFFTVYKPLPLKPLQVLSLKVKENHVVVSMFFILTDHNAASDRSSWSAKREKISLINKSWIPRHLFTDLLISYFLLINLCLISLYLSDLSALSFSLTQTFDQKYIEGFLRDLVTCSCNHAGKTCGDWEIGLGGTGKRMRKLRKNEEIEGLGKRRERRNGEKGEVGKEWENGRLNLRHLSQLSQKS